MSGACNSCGSRGCSCALAFGIVQDAARRLHLNPDECPVGSAIAAVRYALVEAPDRARDVAAVWMREGEACPGWAPCYEPAHGTYCLGCGCYSHDPIEWEWLTACDLPECEYPAVVLFPGRGEAKCERHA